MIVPVDGWVSIPGYEGWYEAHPTGLIRSVDRTIPVVTSRTRPYSIKCKGKVLSPVLSNGYPSVSLWRQHALEVRKVASLIALTFIGPRPDGMYVCHENGVRTESSLSNLYYGTPAQNVADMLRHGTLRHGERTPWAKLREDEVRLIRANPECLSQRELADRFGVNQSRVGKIQRREQWKHVA